MEREHDYSDDQQKITCKECQMGRLSRRYITYLTWLGEELITVPDFPAWVCDVCGSRMYDSRAIGRLSLLLSPNAGRPTLKQHSPVLNPIQPKKTQPSPPE